MNERKFLRKSNTILSIGFAIVVSASAIASAAERVFIPVPKSVIYAGQRLSGELLRDRSVPVNYLNKVSVFANPAEIVGKVARTTLMPGRPIPVNYVIEPNVVEVNRKTAVNKADGDNEMKAKQAASEYRAALHILTPQSPNWSPPVITISGLTGVGLDQLWQNIEDNRDALTKSGEFIEKRNSQAVKWMHEMIEARLLARLQENDDIIKLISDCETEVRGGALTPTLGAQRICEFLQA